MRWVGSLRLPIAGPYHPRADLYAGPSGATWWTVRLWEEGRAVLRVLPGEAVRTFARQNRLGGVLAAAEALLAEAESRGASP